MSCSSYSEAMKRAEQNVKKDENLIEQQQKRLQEMAADGPPTAINDENQKL